MPNIIKQFCIECNISWQFVKFLFTGALNTLFGYGVFALCTLLGFHYAISTLIATVLGVLFNFKTIGIIVFKNNNNSLIFKFFGIYSITYFFTVGILKLLSIFNFGNTYLNYAILLLPNALLSFCLMKKFVFNKGNV